MAKIPYRFEPLVREEDPDQCLTLTSTGNSTITLTKTGDPIVDGLYYKIGRGIWTPYVIDTVINLADGEYVQFKNKKKQLSISSNDFIQFVMTGSIAAAGNMQSLLGWSETAVESCFRNLFSYCTSLTSAPRLPALKIETQCYFRMFRGCTGLTEAPELPATTLAEGCYNGMFQECTSLTQTPNLPATTLADNCYQQMFYGCTSLEEAKDLPAETLTYRCYYLMFYQCTSLIQPPIIKAKTLAIECCRQMFAQATSLQYSPYLAAETLVSGCYNRMFQNCSSLATIKSAFTAWNDEDECTTNWLQNVAANGFFVRDEALSTVHDASHIPTNWGRNMKSLSLVAQQSNSTVTLNAVGNVDYSGIQYRIISSGSTVYGPWLPYVINSAVTVPNVNDFVQFRNTREEFSLNASNYFQFSFTGQIRGTGWIQSLLNYKDEVDYESFIYLFRSCTVLTASPVLNATRLNGVYPYAAMFQGCTGLTTLPYLLNQKLTNGCYSNMFNGCTAITTKNGDLNAKDPVSTCYYRMFYGCTGLTTAPAIKLNTLTYRCLKEMFRGCTSLNNIQVNFTNWGSADDEITTDWVLNVKSTGTFTKPSALPSTRGNSYIPSGWTITTQ